MATRAGDNAGSFAASLISFSFDAKLRTHELESREQLLAFFSAESWRLLDAVCESERNDAATAEHGTIMSCADQTRRSLLLTALATGACLAATRSTAAEQDQPGADMRPQKGDLLVVSDGEHEGEIVKPDDLKLGGPPVRAWPKDPKTSVVRDGSRLNEILIVKLDPGELDGAVKSHAADGIVAYSAVCTHAACPVTEWVKAEDSDKNVFKCPCHNSEFDPRQGAQVVFGPAQRRLAALPLVTSDGSLVVAATFIGKVGGQQGG
jgi:rieske iron-sulfur protein